MIRTGRTDVNKSEQIVFIKTVSTVHFTGAITQYDHEMENLIGLITNRIYIREINIQSMQPLRFNLIFWQSSDGPDTNIDSDSFKSNVLLDMSDGITPFRINNAGQYYLDVDDLNILYEDTNVTQTLHVSLQNLSPTAKTAGSAGAVQIDIGYAPRL